jgi:hypothetical protein
MNCLEAETKNHKGSTVGSSYVEWLLLVESAQQDLGLQQREPH